MCCARLLPEATASRRDRCRAKPRGGDRWSTPSVDAVCHGTLGLDPRLGGPKRRRSSVFSIAREGDGWSHTTNFDRSETLDLALFGFAGTVDSRLEDPDPAQPDFDAS